MLFVSPCNYLIFFKNKQICKSIKKYFARWLISGFKTKKNEDTLSTFILSLLCFILVREEMPNDDAKNDKDAISVINDSQEIPFNDQEDIPENEEAYDELKTPK